MNTPYFKLTPISDPPKKADWYIVVGMATGVNHFYYDDGWYQDKFAAAYPQNKMKMPVDDKYLAPLAEPVEGMGWVKASDRLPSIFDSHERHYRVDGKKVDGGLFRKRPNGDFVFEYRHNSGFITNADLSSVEWLDESASSTPSAREAEAPALIQQAAEKEANEQIVSLQANMMFDEKESELLFEHFKDCYLSAALTKWIPIGRVKGTKDKEVRCALLPLYGKPGGYISAFWDEKNQEWIDGMKYIIDSGAYILDHNNEYETKELQRLWPREAEQQTKIDQLRNLVRKVYARGKEREAELERELQKVKESFKRVCNNGGIQGWAFTKGWVLHSSHRYYYKQNCDWPPKEDEMKELGEIQLMFLNEHNL